MIVLACDMGGTRIKLGLLKNGKIIAQKLISSYSKEGLKPRLPHLKAAWLELLTEQNIQLKECSGIGMGFPSLVNNRDSIVLDEHGKFSDAVGMDLNTWSDQEFNLPIAIENDARLALIGEWKFGAGKGYNDVVIMTLGTGIGTSAVIEGQVLRGKHFQAGCLGGHLSVNYNGRNCQCGNIGCAEAEASTSRLQEIVKEHPEFQNSLLKNNEIIDYKAVFTLAAKGDKCSKDVLNHTLKVWSTLAVDLIHSYDPEILILHGGIMKSKDVIIPAIQSYVDKHARTPWGSVIVNNGELSDNAALSGCEWLVKEKLKAQ